MSATLPIYVQTPISLSGVTTLKIVLRFLFPDGRRHPMLT